MTKLYKPDSKLLLFARKTLITTTNIDDYKRALCVVLSADYRLTTVELSKLLGFSVRTILKSREELDCLRKGEKYVCLEWGGRRNALLTEEEETKFLAKYEKKALNGELVSCVEMRNEFAKLVGRPSAKETCYKLLRRRGWKMVKRGLWGIPKKKTKKTDNKDAKAKANTPKPRKTTAKAQAKPAKPAQTRPKTAAKPPKPRAKSAKAGGKGGKRG